MAVSFIGGGNIMAVSFIGGGNIMAVSFIGGGNIMDKKWFTCWLSVRGRSLPSHRRMKRNTIK
jgi:hypothetical protein